MPNEKNAANTASAAIKPSDKKKRSWLKWGCCGLPVALLLLFIIVGLLASPSDKEENKESAQVPSQAPTEQVKQEESAPVQSVEEKKPVEEVKPTVKKYEVVYTGTNKRYDGGVNYYVLIDPVDLASDEFKSDIKEIVKKLVQEKGSKTSLEFHDKRESLDLSYHQYGDMSLVRPRTADENELIAVHYVAAFSGDLEIGIYKNTLDFFPATFTDHETVGKYREGVEFNP